MSQWIPIEERKPAAIDADDYHAVWITNGIGEVRQVSFNSRQVQGRHEYPEMNAIAWMACHKPEPYVPGSREQGLQVPHLLLAGCVSQATRVGG